MSALPDILGLTDIVNRWTYTRESIRLLMKSDGDFPASIGAINNGRNRIWLKDDIVEYERRRPRLTRPRQIQDQDRESVRSQRPATGRPDQGHPRAEVEHCRAGYQFGQKPPFAFRESLKKHGWTYEPASGRWVGVVRRKELAGFDREFARYGWRRTMTEDTEDG